MKKQLLFIASLFTAFSLSAQSQLPNSDFEIWETNAEFDIVEPKDWIAPSICATFQEFNSCVLFFEKSQGHSGFAVKVITRKDSQTEEFNTLPLLYGDVFSDKPEKVTFWYKSTKNVSANAFLSSGDFFEDENADEVGAGGIEANTSGDFKKAEFPISYVQGKTHDHFYLAFTFGEEEELTADDYFIIDDVQLSYGLAGLSDKQMTQIIGSNVITSSLNLKESVEELNVYNTSGVQVLNVTNTQAADFSSLPEGLYMVTLKKGNSMGTIKVIKK
ncbi:T9SS type A sorting domain-containing protein [Sporocytophaga myxococcoides]|uniref:T9SS type A sorting domain-containing protein n=1 Tax=Sporocytophaga myxococcoides TaxID=153721 RepID=UPI000402C084|nr:T9SS type A sorting domain-containing protein [Sporocytophaga myxococcoides]